jgi:hypothetical protein
MEVLKSGLVMDIPGLFGREGLDSELELSEEFEPCFVKGVNCGYDQWYNDLYLLRSFVVKSSSSTNRFRCPRLKYLSKDLWTSSLALLV